MAYRIRRTITRFTFKNRTDRDYRTLKVLQSFRDPDGFVIQSGDRIFRCVLPHAVADVRAFLTSDSAKISFPGIS